MPWSPLKSDSISFEVDPAIPRLCSWLPVVATDDDDVAAVVVVVVGFVASTTDDDAVVWNLGTLKLNFMSLFMLQTSKQANKKINNQANNQTIKIA